MKKALFFTFVFVFLSFLVEAQKVVTGLVIDSETEQALQGVLIKEDNGKNAVVTTADGHFVIAISSDTATIITQLVLYKPKKIKVQAGKNYVIKLQTAPVDLKQIVISADDNSEQNASVSLSKVDLRLKPVNTSQEILRLIPGLFIAQHEGGGKAEQIFLRGFDMDHGTDISVNVDGLPVNMVTHAHGQGYADLHFLIPEIVDNIQFEKGPYNVHYGDFETGAFINFKTKNYLRHNRIQLESGMFNTKRLLAMFNILGKNNTGQNAYIASEYMMSDGFFDRSQNFNRLNIFGKYIARLSEKTSLMAEASIFKTRWDAAGLIPQRAVDSGLIDRFGEIDDAGGGLTHRNNILLRFDTKITDKSRLTNTLYFSDYAFNLFSDFTFFLKDTVNGDAIEQSENRQIYGYNFNYVKTDKNFTFNAGGGFKYDDINDLRLAHVKERKLLNIFTLNDVDETNAFFFANETMRFKRFNVNMGVRMDYFNFLLTDKLFPNYKTDTYEKYLISPKVSLSYSLNNRMQVYLKAGKGFHSNDARVISDKNNDILPVAYGSDLGIVYRPADMVIVSMAAWYLYLQQEFTFSGDEGTIEAGGETQREGIDFSTHIEFARWLYARFDVNYAYARNLGVSDGEIYVPLAPVWSSVGGLYVRNLHGLSGSISYRYLGKRPADEMNNLQTSPYTVVDASLDYTVKHYEVGLDIQNLLNTEWKDAQFETTTRLPGESEPHTDICFTPGTPFMLKAKIAFLF